MLDITEEEPLADLRGAPGMRAPPGSKFFHFHAVFGKNLKNNSNFGSWRPPPQGKSWIRHWELMLAFKNIKQTTTITKYHDFQLRLLHGVIFTNNILYHWKKVASQECEFCENTKQMLFHLMINCPVMKAIWTQFNAYLENCTNINTNELEMNPKNILLNTVHPKPGHIVNLLTLIIKKTVYAQKCLKKSLRFDSIVQKFETIYQIERYYAQVKGVSHKNAKKWALYCKQNQSGN